MRKLFFWVVGLIIWQTSFGQNSFNAEFSKIMNEELKIMPIVKELTSKFSISDINKMIEDCEKNKESKDELSVKIRLVKASFQFIRDQFKKVIVTEYGSLARFQNNDFKKKIDDYNKQFSANPACLGCVSGCYGAYSFCLTEGNPNWLCDLNRAICVALCYAPGGPCQNVE